MGYQSSWALPYIEVCIHVQRARHQKGREKKEEGKVNRKNKEKTKNKIHIDENMIKFNSYVLYKNSSY